MEKVQIFCSIHLSKDRNKNLSKGRNKNLSKDRNKNYEKIYYQRLVKLVSHSGEPFSLLFVAMIGTSRGVDRVCECFVGQAKEKKERKEKEEKEGEKEKRVGSGEKFLEDC